MKELRTERTLNFSQHYYIRILLAHILGDRRPEHVQQLFNSTQGNELVDDKCENAGARRRTGSPSTRSRGGGE
eukprot:8559725-Heterocapsa_arctica.AAC.1